MQVSIKLGMLVLIALTSVFPASIEASGPQHTTRVVLLGTQGGPVANPDRSEPASLLVVDGEPYLIDAGAGVVRQVAAAGYQPVDVVTIFLTHHHLDHTAGLEPLMALSWIGNARGNNVPRQIYGPPSTVFLVRKAVEYIGTSERIFRASMTALPAVGGFFVGHDIDHNGMVLTNDSVHVTAAENSHFQIASFGPDGKRDMSFSYRFDTPKGSVVFTGDTGPSNAVVELAKGADVLVSEVYLPAPGMPGSGTEPDPTSPIMRQLSEHMAREHLSPAEVGKIAQRAGVKSVILTHTVTGNSKELEDRIVARVREFYTGDIIMGHDLLSFELGPKHAPIR